MFRPLHSLGAAGLLALSLASQAPAAPVVSQNSLGAGEGVGASIFLPVDDFNVTQTTTLDYFRVFLADSSPLLGGDGLANGVFSSFSGVLSWYIFADAALLPGALVASGTAVGVTVNDSGVDRIGEDVFYVSAFFGAGLGAGPVLDPGHYWFGVREGVPGAAFDATGIRWLGATTLTDAPAKIFLDGAGISNLNEAPSQDLTYNIVGTVHDVPEPATGGLLAAGLLALMAATSRRRR